MKTKKKWSKYIMAYGDQIHIFLSDFNLKGSGYMNIATSCCIEMAKAHKKVIALGVGYDGSPHRFPFTLIPIHPQAMMQYVGAMFNNLQGLSQNKAIPPIGSLVVAMDIPLQLQFLQMPRAAEIPYIGIFPVESGPIRNSWAQGLQQMDARLVMSQYGVEQLSERDVKSEYIHLGLHDTWRSPEDGEVKAIREAFGYTDEDYVVITVADNHERKNLSAAMQMVAQARKLIPNIKWVVVTRKENRHTVGWDVDDLAVDLGIDDISMSFDRGLTFADLWKLVTMSDLFLLTSKAEGLCMPILEAMATRTPVLASDCTAIPEHIFVDPHRRASNVHEGKRGFTIPIAFHHLDVWGNSDRAYVNVSAGAAQIFKIAKMRGTEALDKIVERAYQYAKGRTWDRAGAQLNRVIDSLEPKLPQQPPSIPAGIPQVVPPVVPQIKFGDGGDEQP